MSVHTDKVIPGGNRTRYQGGIYDCIWKKRIGDYMPHQFEWYRDNKPVYYRLRLLSGAVFFTTQSHANLG